MKGVREGVEVVVRNGRHGGGRAGGRVGWVRDERRVLGSCVGGSGGLGGRDRV